MSVDNIINELGGTMAVSRGLGTESSVVSNWRRRGYIPADRWTEIVDLAKKSRVKAVTFERLAKVRSLAEARA